MQDRSAEQANSGDAESPLDVIEVCVRTGTLDGLLGGPKIRLHFLVATDTGSVVYS